VFTSVRVARLDEMLSSFSDQFMIVSITNHQRCQVSEHLSEHTFQKKQDPQEFLIVKADESL